MIHKSPLGWCPELLAPHNAIRISDLVISALILTDLTSRVFEQPNLEGRILCSSVRYPEKTLLSYPLLSALLRSAVQFSLLGAKYRPGHTHGTVGFLGIA